MRMVVDRACLGIGQTALFSARKPQEDRAAPTSGNLEKCFREDRTRSRYLLCDTSMRDLMEDVRFYLCKAT